MRQRLALLTLGAAMVAALVFPSTANASPATSQTVPSSFTCIAPCSFGFGQDTAGAGEDFASVAALPRRPRHRVRGVRGGEQSGPRLAHHLPAGWAGRLLPDSRAERHHLRHAGRLPEGSSPGRDPDGHHRLYFPGRHWGPRGRDWHGLGDRAGTDRHLLSAPRRVHGADAEQHLRGQQFERSRTRLGTWSPAQNVKGGLTFAHNQSAAQPA